MTTEAIRISSSGFSRQSCLSSTDVLVRKSIMRHATVVEVCRQDRWRDIYSYRCGHCARGLLGPLPKIGQRCRVCGAVVIQVPDSNQSSRTSAAGMGARRDGRALRVKGAKASRRSAVTQPSAAPGSSGPADMPKK